MKVNRRSKQRIDIADSGALSDLAFLLIVFFIVIAVFNVNKGFLLGLPQKNSTKIVNTEDIIRLTVEADNTIVFEDRRIDFPEMEKIITDRVSLRPNIIVLIRIHPEARYQRVVSMVDSIKKCDVDNFSFSMIKE